MNGTLRKADVVILYQMKTNCILNFKYVLSHHH